LGLLPVVLPEVVQQYHDRLARQRAEEEIHKLNRELEQKLLLAEKMAALGSLVAEATHEINTPLGTGITVVSSLSEKTRAIEDLFYGETIKRSDLENYLKMEEEALQIILSNLNRAAELIRSFKIVTVDQCSEKRRRFKLKKYLDEILLSLRPKLKRTRHTVRINCPEDIELDTVPGAFSQIITNLVVNSLVHGFESKEQGEIVIDVHREHDHGVLKYSDNGKGIEEEYLAKIFDPFFTTKRENGGSGIGMNIVHKLVVQKLHGRIECESTLGVGITFTIHIPLTLEENHEHR
jgi:signal transduction histidine kinase